VTIAPALSSMCPAPRQWQPGSASDGALAVYRVVFDTDLTPPEGQAGTVAVGLSLNLGLALRGKKNRGEKIVSTKHSFAEAAEAAFELNQGRWNERVRENYRSSLDNHVLPYFDGFLKDYDWESIIEFRKHLEAKGLSGWTVRNIFKPLRVTFSYALKKRWIAHNPMGDLEQGDGPTVEARKPLILSPEQIAALLSKAGDYRTFVELGFYGLRKGEVLGLTWGDLDRENLTLRVDKQWRKDGVVSTPKTKASVRVVGIEEATARRLTLLRLKSKHSQDSDPILCTRTGTHLLHSNVHRSWTGLGWLLACPIFTTTTYGTTLLPCSTPRG
jgi:integrase